MVVLVVVIVDDADDRWAHLVVVEPSGFDVVNRDLFIVSFLGLPFVFNSSGLFTNLAPVVLEVLCDGLCVDDLGLANASQSRKPAVGLDQGEVGCRVGDIPTIVITD